MNSNDPSAFPRYVSATDLRAALPGRLAVDALEAGFMARQSGDETPRLVLDHELGDFLLMPASGREGAGAKLVTVAPANPGRGLPLINGLYVLFSRETLVPEALIDGAALTQLRTAAVSGLAARHLARSESTRLLIFGAGAQAEAHAAVLAELLPIKEVKIVGSSPRSPHAVGLAERLCSAGLQASVGTDRDVPWADVLCTCTTSCSPVFDSSLLGRGAHVSAIGAYRPDMRELDFDLLVRALLIVETREAARREAGDLIQAVDAGILAADDIGADLVDLLEGKVQREDGDQISVFKSVGLPSEDLIVARAILDRLGTEAPDSVSV